MLALKTIYGTWKVREKSMKLKVLAMSVIVMAGFFAHAESSDQKFINSELRMMDKMFSSKVDRAKHVCSFIEVGGADATYLQERAQAIDLAYKTQSLTVEPEMIQHVAGIISKANEAPVKPLEALWVARICLGAKE
jgi:isopropylmalate/homocitrate/citramalate synthase